MTDVEFAELMDKLRQIQREVLRAMDIIENYKRSSDYAESKVTHLPLKYCGQGFAHGPHDWPPFGFEHLPNAYHCEGGADQSDSHPDNQM